MVTLFSTKCFLFIYMYIDLFKFKAYKLFENSDADLSLPTCLCKCPIVTSTFQDKSRDLNEILLSFCMCAKHHSI